MRIAKLAKDTVERSLLKQKNKSTKEPVQHDAMQYGLPVEKRRPRRSQPYTYRAISGIKSLIARYLGDAVTHVAVIKCLMGDFKNNTGSSWTQ